MEDIKEKLKQYTKDMGDFIVPFLVKYDIKTKEIYISITSKADDLDGYITEYQSYINKKTISNDDIYCIVYLEKGEVIYEKLEQKKI